MMRTGLEAWNFAEWRSGLSFSLAATSGDHCTNGGPIPDNRDSRGWLRPGLLAFVAGGRRNLGCVERSPFLPGCDPLGLRRPWSGIFGWLRRLFGIFVRDSRRRLDCLARTSSALREGLRIAAFCVAPRRPSGVCFGYRRLE